MNTTYIERRIERIKWARLFDELRLSSGELTPRIKVIFRNTLSPRLIWELEQVTPIELMEWVAWQVELWGL